MKTTTNKHYSLEYSNQSGAVLVVSLLILLVMTMTSLTAMQSTSLEEKMAGNMRDRNLAFQAAESALRDAELTIWAMTPASMDTFATAGSLLDIDTTDYDPYDTATWADESSIQYSTSIAIVNTLPRYYIKHSGRFDYVEGGMEMGHDYAAKPKVSTFRVTSLGTGGSDAARVVLRSNFARIGLETD